MIVGSAEKNAAWQEMGTKHLINRRVPSFTRSAIKGLEVLHKAIGEIAVAALTPGKDS